MTPDRILTIALLLPVAAHATPCTGIVQVQPGDVSPCRGALVGADAIAAIAATRDAAAACGRDLHECRRRASLPLPLDCTPVFVEVPVPTRACDRRAHVLDRCAGVWRGWACRWGGCCSLCRR
jgi:hypothetical protein